MVALELQSALAQEIRNLTEHMTFKDYKGNPAKLNVYEQNLPKRRIRKSNEYADEELEEDEDGVEEFFPYCIVKLDSGNSKDADSAHLVKTALIVGIFDDSEKADGYKSILNIFEDIRYRFRTNPVLDKRYICGDEISWALADEDEDTYPYFFGGMYLDWQTAELRREDSFV